MLTIDVKTKAVSGWDRRSPMARNKFGDATPGYVRGWIEPHYPVPSIIGEVFWVGGGNYTTLIIMDADEGWDPRYVAYLGKWEEAELFVEDTSSPNYRP